MADWTAITGIVVSGLAGPAALSYLAGKRQQDRLQHERSLADRAELRDVLDQASRTSREAMWGVEAMSLLLERRRFDREEFSRIESELEAATKEAALASGRIELRLGEAHPVARAYEELSVVYEGTLSRLLELTRPQLGLRRMPVNPWSVRRELMKVTAEAQPEFRAARARFIEASQEFVGAEL